MTQRRRADVVGSVHRPDGRHVTLVAASRGVLPWERTRARPATRGRWCGAGSGRGGSGSGRGRGGVGAGAGAGRAPGGAGPGAGAGRAGAGAGRAPAQVGRVGRRSAGRPTRSRGHLRLVGPLWVAPAPPSTPVPSTAWSDRRSLELAPGGDPRRRTGNPRGSWDCWGRSDRCARHPSLPSREPRGEPGRTGPRVSGAAGSGAGGVVRRSGAAAGWRGEAGRRWAGGAKLGGGGVVGRSWAAPSRGAGSGRAGGG
jgi:hypothetical protein